MLLRGIVLSLFWLCFLKHARTKTEVYLQKFFALEYFWRGVMCVRFPGYATTVVEQRQQQQPWQEGSGRFVILQVLLFLLLLFLLHLFPLFFISTLIFQSFTVYSSLVFFPPIVLIQGIGKHCDKLPCTYVLHAGAPNFFVSGRPPHISLQNSQPLFPSVPTPLISSNSRAAATSDTHCEHWLLLHGIANGIVNCIVQCSWYCLVLQWYCNGILWHYGIVNGIAWMSLRHPPVRGCSYITKYNLGLSEDPPPPKICNTVINREDPVKLRLPPFRDYVIYEQPLMLSKGLGCFWNTFGGGKGVRNSKGWKGQKVGFRPSLLLVVEGWFFVPGHVCNL